MCVGSNANASNPASQAAQAYFRQQVPNSRFANNDGFASVFGQLLAKRNGAAGAQPQGQSSVQPRTQAIGG